MTKTVLLTGATDGIGLETAAALVSKGHRVLVHGRSPAKLDSSVLRLEGLPGGGEVERYLADLSRLDEVEALAQQVAGRHGRIDVLINNAGIYRTDNPITADGLDVRFVVNCIAPWLLTQQLLPSMAADGRIVNLSSAAQAPVDLEALAGRRRLAEDFDAYAQSKLAITMWSRSLAQTLGEHGPMVVAVNPGSLLATKMVKEGFGVSGNDIGIGVDILLRAALADEFANASGQYFDNDTGRFAAPHADALDEQKCHAVVLAIESVVTGMTQ